MNSVCCCCCCVLVRERHCWKQHYIRMTRPSLFNDVSLHSYVLCGRMQIAHIRYVKILTWLRGFLVIFVYLVWFSLCFSFFWELRENGVVNNLQLCPLSLGVMLDFLYISLVPVPDPYPQIRWGGAQFGLKIRGGGLPGTLLWIRHWKQEVKRAGGLSDETSTREDRGHQFLNLSLNRLRERLLVVYLPINVSVIPLNHCAT